MKFKFTQVKSYIDKYQDLWILSREKEIYYLGYRGNLVCMCVCTDKKKKKKKKEKERKKGNYYLHVREKKMVKETKNLKRRSWGNINQA